MLLYIVQAEITDGLVDLLKDDANPVTFYCQATGEPIPIISWDFNGEVISSSDTSTYNISNSLNGSVITSSITIMNTSNDVGIYTCNANNTFGTDRKSAVLTTNGMYILNFFHTCRCVLVMHHLYRYFCNP